MKTVTQEMIDQAKQDLKKCEELKEYPLVYFDQKKLQLLEIHRDLIHHDVLCFYTAPDGEITWLHDDSGEPEGYEEHCLSLTEEHDVLHAIHCFDAISYALRGPNHSIAWLIQQYLKTKNPDKWLDSIKDKKKVAKVREILTHWEKYETRGPLIDQYIDNSYGTAVNERGTIFDVVDASDEQYPNVRFGWYYKTPKKRVIAAYIEANDQHRASWCIE